MRLPQFQKKRFKVPKHAHDRFHKIAARMPEQNHIAGCYDHVRDISVLCVVCDEQQKHLGPEEAVHDEGHIEVDFFLFQRLDQPLSLTAYLRPELSNFDFIPSPGIVSVKLGQADVDSGLVPQENWREEHQRWVSFRLNNAHGTLIETQKIAVRLDDGQPGTDPEDHLHLKTKKGPRPASNTANQSAGLVGQPVFSPHFHNTVAANALASPTSTQLEGVKMGNNNSDQNFTARDITDSHITQTMAETVEKSFNEGSAAAKENGSEELATHISNLGNQVKELLLKADESNAQQLKAYSEMLLGQAKAKKPDHTLLDVSAKGLLKAAKAVGTVAAPIVMTVKLILTNLGYPIPDGWDIF